MNDGHVEFSAVTNELWIGGGDWKTIFQLYAADNHRVVVSHLVASFKGTSNGATPVKVELVWQSNAGNMAALVVNKTHPGQDPETLQVTAQQDAYPTGGSPGYTGGTGEPTLQHVIWSEEVHPQAGRFEFPIGLRDTIVKVAGSGSYRRLGVRCFAAANVRVLVSCRGSE